MAARVNSKIVLVLLIVAFGAAVAVGGLWYVRQGDVARMAQLGDEFMQEGDITAAITQYGRAVRRDPGNIEYLRKLQNAVLQAQPRTGDEARELYSRWISTLAHDAEYHGHQAEPHLKLLEELRTNARLVRMLAGPTAQRPFWEQIASAANDMMARLPETDPKYIYGKLYRGMANVNLHSTLSDEELGRAEQDLRDFVEAVPEEDLGWASLITGLRTLAEFYRTSGQSRRADEAIRASRDLVFQAREAVPEGPEVAALYALELTQIRQRNPDQVTDQDVTEALDHMVRLVSGTDDAARVRTAANVLLSAGDVARLDQAVDLYREYLDRHPDALVQQLVLATVQYRLGRLDDAWRLADAILDAEPLRVSFIAQIQLELRRQAASLLVDVAYERWSRAPETEQAAALQQLQESRDTLAAMAIDPENSPLVIRADGKLALARQDYRAAAARFDRLVRDGAADVETLHFSALALERIGQLGLAYERLHRALENAQGVLPGLIYNKALFEFRLGRFEDAAKSIEQFLQLSPEDARGLQLAGSIRASMTGDDEVAADPVRLAIQQAGAAINEGDTLTARATIQSALNERPDDVGLLHTAARVEMSAGDMEEARRYVDRGLSMQPENRILRRLRATLATDDPIEAARVFYEQEHPDNEARQAVALAIVYGTMAEQQERLATHHQLRGDDGDAEAARTLAQRAAAEAERKREAAQRLAPDSPELIEYLFGRAIRTQDWSRAETLAQRAASLNIDQVGGSLFRGILELDRGNGEQAVRYFREVTDRMPYSGQGWRGLAMAYQQVGNIREAQRAYDQAYRINPNDMVTVRNYLGLLMGRGESIRALRIAQQARRLQPANIELRELWLELEAKAGDRVLTLRTRRDIYRNNPDDRPNAMRLALMLSQTEVSPDLILEEDGTRRFSDRRWRTMSVADQRRTLEEEAAVWRREVDRILRRLVDREGMDLELAVLEATILRERGDAVRGEGHIRAFIESQPIEEQTTDQWLALTQYLIEANMLNQAYNTMIHARSLQDPERREVDAALGHFLFSQGQYAMARQHYEQVLEVSSQRDVRLRLIESLINLEDYDEAQRRVAPLVEAAEPEPMARLLHAMILRGQMNRLIEAGQIAEAERTLERHYAELDAAERGLPTDTAPLILRAQSLFRDYLRTNQRSLLDDARAALTRASQIQPNDRRIALVRADVYRELGDLRTATSELTRLIERDPSDTQARRILMQLHMDSGDLAAAMRVVNDAIRRYPSAPGWYAELAKLHRQRGDLVAATEAYRQAFSHSDMPLHLHLAITTALDQGQASYPQILQEVRTRPDLVEVNLPLQGLKAFLMYKSGEVEPALEATRRSYRELRELLAQGRVPLAAASDWYQAFDRLMNEWEPAEAESLIVELAGGDLNAQDLRWLARRWSSAEGGLSRAEELARRSVDALEAEQKQLRATILLELSNYQLRMGSYAAATETLKRLVEVEPDNAMARNNLAFLLADRLDRPEEALEHAERAYALLPQNSSVVDTYGWVHFKLNRLDRAEQLLRESLELQETAVTRLHLAHVLLGQNRREAAMNALRRAAELNPDARTQAEIDRLLDDRRTGSAG